MEEERPLGDGEIWTDCARTAERFRAWSICSIGEKVMCVNKRARGKKAALLKSGEPGGAVSLYVHTRLAGTIAELRLFSGLGCLLPSLAVCHLSGLRGH